jgi:hypothetical protein
VVERDHPHIRQLSRIDELQLIALNLEDRHFVVVEPKAARQFGRNPDGILCAQPLALALLGQLIE